MRRVVYAPVFFVVLGAMALWPAGNGEAKNPAAQFAPVVIDVTTIDADRAARILRELYPSARIRVDHSANAIIAIVSPATANAMRTVVAGIDVKSPESPSTDVEQLHSAPTGDVLTKLRSLFPRARFITGPNRTIVASATQQDLAQIRQIVTALDTPVATPAPTYPPAEAVRVTQRSAKPIARAVAQTVPHVRVAVSGSQILLRGDADDVQHAEKLIAQLDEPDANVRYTQIYRLRRIDAKSVADLLSRSFPNVKIEVDSDLNAITVSATSAVHRRIADAVEQLDAVQTNASGGLPVDQPGAAASAGNFEVINLKAAVPGLNGSPSTSATDIATTVQQALSGQAPDLKITVPPNSTQLILTGSPYSIKLAKDLVAQLDVAQPLVVLDTEVLEVDEQVAKNLGLQFQQPVVSSTFTEIGPSPDPFTGATPPLMRLHGIGRTPLTVGLQLNLLLQNGNARILSDPRITTISGRTASIRAGDTISILTTTGGGAGTVATTQLQSFQTGVTLDITPVVNAGGFISVTIHPTVNNLSGILNGVPQISTRDTTTTVDLKEDQTLIIGGLIEDSVNRTQQKIPVLGDLPLVGHAFRSDSINKQRNELIITVTPHILNPGEAYVSPGPPLPGVPSPQPLPTLPPGTTLPQPLPPHHPEPTPIAVATAAPTPVTYAQTQTTPAPSPTPSAFAQSNTFTYGRPPQNNHANASDPVKIFYAQVSPTVVRNGGTVNIQAITTTNVARLEWGSGTAWHEIPQVGSGEWTGSVPLSGDVSTSGADANVTLRAVRIDGQTASIQVPVSITQ